ncbi:MAG TPA: cytochrome c, partial [Pyrinomonadaceae bacterium]|nr:cytochrome c [Pyrinomonadaceae bacterium]
SGGATGGTAASSQAQGVGQTGGVGTAGANLQSTQQGGAQSTGDVNVRGNVAGGIPAGASGGAGVGQEGAGQAATFPGPDRFPFPVSEQLVNRGQERFNIYCAMCHGPTGEADGMIVRRGFRRPPSFHEDRLQAGQSNAAHYFDVISNGWGAMPSYADMIPWEDRWAIIAYVRALQLSRRANVNDLPPDARSRVGAPAAATTPAAGQQQEGGSHR